MFIDPFGQSIILGRGPTSFEFGAVLPQAVQLEVESIFEIGEFRGDDRLLSEDGGYKDDAVGFSEDMIAGEDGGAADSNETLHVAARSLTPARTLTPTTKSR